MTFKTISLISIVVSSLIGGPDVAIANPIKAEAPVAGPVDFELSVISAEVTVLASTSPRVAIEVDNGRTGKGQALSSIGLNKRGNKRVTVSFDNSSTLQSGLVRVLLPSSSNIEVNSISGEVTVGRVGGNVKAKVVSGEVELTDANNIEVESVSGSVDIRTATGAIRVRTVSGDVNITTRPRPGSRLDFSTTSGDLEWSGLCQAGCRIDATTLSGDVDLQLHSGSDFEVRFTSFSGDLDDRLKMSINQSGGKWGTNRVITGRYGKGVGKIECTTHSGDLEVAKGP